MNELPPPAQPPAATDDAVLAKALQHQRAQYQQGLLKALRAGYPAEAFRQLQANEAFRALQANEAYRALQANEAYRLMQANEAFRQVQASDAGGEQAAGAWLDMRSVRGGSNSCRHLAQMRRTRRWASTALTTRAAPAR